MGRSNPQRTKSPPATGNQVIRGRPNQILDHLPIRGARQLDCSHNVAWIATHQNDSGGFNRHIRTRANRNSDIGGRKGGRVVDPVPHHSDSLSTCLKPPYCRSFLGGQNLCCDLINPDASSHRIGNGFRVSRDHRHPDAQPVKFRDGVQGLGTDLILNSESAEQSPSPDDIQNCLAFRCPSSGRLLNFWRHYSPGLDQQARSTDHNPLSIYNRTRPSACQCLKIPSLELGYTSALGFFDDGLGERVFGVDLNGSGKSD
jgi:hypothetical protein